MIDSIAFIWIELIGIMFLWSGMSAFENPDRQDKLPTIQIVVGLITMLSGAVL